MNKKTGIRVVQTFLYLLVAVIFFGSLYYSIKTGEFSWFGRFGSIITIMPIIISLFELSIDRRSLFFSKNNYCKLAPDNVEELSAKYWPIVIWVNSMISIIGTVIWGFGDLLGNVMKAS